MAVLQSEIFPRDITAELCLNVFATGEITLFFDSCDAFTNINTHLTTAEAAWLGRRLLETVERLEPPQAGPYDAHAPEDPQGLENPQGLED